MGMRIIDIAQEAGVSLMTVSRAINPQERRKVSPETLKIIDEIVKRSGFKPNTAARHLRKSATKIIGIIFPYYPGVFYSTYYSHILSGVADYLVNTEYQFKLILLKEQDSYWDNYDFSAGERVDGLIVTHWTQVFSMKSYLEKIDIPCVVINDFEKDLKIGIVYGDSYGGGQTAAKYLFDKGHKHVAILNGPAWSKDAEQRIDGFQDFYNKKGIKIRPDLIVRADFSERKAFEQTASLIRKDPKITAIFCCNDEMAYGVLQRLNELGINCPKRISVFGFDNNFQSAHVQPPLTTISVPVYDLAVESARSLVMHLQSPKSKNRFTGSKILPMQLIERESVRDLK